MESSSKLCEDSAKNCAVRLEDCTKRQTGEIEREILSFVGKVGQKVNNYHSTDQFILCYSDHTPVLGLQRKPK